ncbi:MAG: efflux RND transporter periplasmic adaptor subunit [SAR324 cluster bacterium]|nr:efflux RND transporter periplasmic adaptor subunit [SAR324 cluster bacterium]
MHLSLKKFKLLFFIFSIVLLPQGGMAEKQTAATNVETLELVARQLELKSTYVGYLEPFERVSIRSEADGTAEKIGFDEGQSVKKGEVLVNISTVRLGLKEKLARANYEFAESEYKTEKTLFDRQVSTASKLDSYKTKRDVEKINLEIAQYDLEQSKVKSPISGVVKSKTINIGEVVGRGQELFEIMDISRVLASIHIPEREMMFVTPGKKVKIRIDAIPGIVFTGEVKTLGLEADLQNRSFPAEIIINNSERQLLPGMMARVEMVTTAVANEIIIPRHAVLEREHGRIVFVENNEIALEKPVQLGTIIKDEVQVIFGLQPGEKLVVTGHQFLADQEKVHVSSARQQTK